MSTNNIVDRENSRWCGSMPSKKMAMDYIKNLENKYGKYYRKPDGQYLKYGCEKA